MGKCGSKFGAYLPEIMLSPLSVEQATSANVADLHASMLDSVTGSGSPRILDMTCGMGIDLRALVTHFPECVATGIEYDEIPAAAAQFNFRNCPNVKILHGDSVSWLEAYEGERFDVIFIDPARRDENGGRVFNISQCRPDVVSLLPLLERKCRYAMVKLSPMLDVSRTLHDLRHIFRLHIVDEKGECRELCALLDFSRDIPAEEVELHIHSAQCDYLFTLAEERASTECYGKPMAGDMVFEPSPAAMKGAPFATLCSRHGLRKLHPNTNIFFSKTSVEGLPGRWFELEDVCRMSSASLKTLRAGVPNADVAVRNFPMKAEELQRRMKLKPGGEHRIIGVTVAGGETGQDTHELLVLRKQSRHGLL